MFCLVSVNGQAKFQLTVSNLSVKSLALKINSQPAKSVFPSQSVVFLDSTGIDLLALVDLKINYEYKGKQQVQTMQFVAGDKSKIKLEIYDADSMEFNKGYRLSGLPFPEKQEILVKDFFVRKNDFTQWLKNEYSKINNRLYPNIQTDSVLNIIRAGRRQYLSYIEKFILIHRKSFLSYYIFKSEVLSPQSILNIGKGKAISIFEMLDYSYHKTELGRLLVSYIHDLKSNTVGSQVQNFKFKTKDFEEFELHSYIQNCKALLIFTAMGCKACHEQIPVIKEIKENYGADLKIIYVSLDRSVDEWEKDMNLFSYPGIVTVNISPYNYSTDLQSLFMVEFIPQVFLIGEDRKILYDNLSPYEDDKLMRLKELLSVVEK